MATLPVRPLLQGRLGVAQCAATGAVIVGAAYFLCWLGAAAGWLSASHMFISIFTTAPVASVAALAAGLICAVMTGVIGGALIAVAYNAFSFLAPR